MPFVFGYGSLVDPESVQASLGREAAPGDRFVTRLQGFCRQWNVAAHSDMRPEYLLLHEQRPWSGWIVFLGLQEAADQEVLGAVFRVSDEELASLDHREASYTRVAVGDLLSPGVPWATDEPVFTYVPTVAAVQAAQQVGSAGVVMARYMRLIDRAFRTLGPDGYAEHVASLPPTHPFQIAEISAVPRDPGVRSYAVDPAPPASP